MALPAILETLDTAQQALVKLLQAKAGDLLETGQLTDIDSRIAYRELEGSVQDVILASPAAALSEMSVESQPAIVKQDTGTTVEFPKDYVRFISVRADNWYEDLFELAEPGGVAQVFQSIPYTNATPYKPLAVLVPSAGKTLAKLYPKAKNSVKLVFTPLVAPEKLPVLLIEPLLWLAVSKVLQVDEPSFAGSAQQRYAAAIAALENRPERITA